MYKLAVFEESLNTKNPYLFKEPIDPYVIGGHVLINITGFYIQKKIQNDISKLENDLLLIDKYNNEEFEDTEGHSHEHYN
jgi:hypothetical protein